MTRSFITQCCNPTSSFQSNRDWRDRPASRPNASLPEAIEECTRLQSKSTRIQYRVVLRTEEVIFTPSKA